MKRIRKKPAQYHWCNDIDEDESKHQKEINADIETTSHLHKPWFHRGYVDEQELKAQELEAVGDRKRARWVRYCGTPYAMWWGYRCGLRDCPRCSSITAWKNRQKLRSAIATMKSPRFMMVALPSREIGDLPTTLDGFRKVLSALRRRKCFSSVISGAGCIEPALSKARDHWNLHAHIFIDAEKIDLLEWQRAWSELTGGRGELNVQEVESFSDATGYVIAG